MNISYLPNPDKYTGNQMIYRGDRQEQEVSARWKDDKAVKLVADNKQSESKNGKCD